ncbi:MAG: hypothetical protein RMI34_01355 [Chloroherpetonaceae bacterium]|nr:hypothetical protein [Chloroherpetonaceae bacterium]MCS7212554.1 hypothetical protein [Chloroherpetonaceae bacterium]MDW8018705.1 hypothetical protein [Chloroherpetonaceae bacterium]MDW8466315.1 hypothetical protein [Chloroherpetonaceae bacterium]
MKIVLTLCVLSFSSALFAQARWHVKLIDELQLCALLQAEHRFEQTLRPPTLGHFPSPLFEAYQDRDARPRSPVLAAVFSAALPGAGEFYAESYVRAGLFLVLEAVLWALHIRFLDQGNRAAIDYKNFADAPSELNDGLSRWSAVRYADRLSQIFRNHPNATLRNLALELGSTARLNEIRNKDFRFLNAFERQAVFANGATFSHTLSPFGTQQYYELIGKYSEYAIGWDDFDVRQLSNAFPPASQHFLNYGIRRQEFNDILNRATVVSYFIILNHLLSVVDAVLATSEYNRRFKAGLDFSTNPLTGELIPQTTVRFSF